jgi:hypothetical protein
MIQANYSGDLVFRIFVIFSTGVDAGIYQTLFQSPE